VAQDVIISEYDCGAPSTASTWQESSKPARSSSPLRDRIVGRVSLEKIKDYDGGVIVDINNEITEDLASAIQAAGIERVKIRSVADLRIETRSLRDVLRTQPGVGPAGRNWARATGVIAAQSHRRTRNPAHDCVPANRWLRPSRVSEQSRLDAKSNGAVRFIGLQTVKAKNGGDLVVMNRQGSIAVVDDKGRERERYAVVYGAKLKVNEGDQVTLGTSHGRVGSLLPSRS